MNCIIWKKVQCDGRWVVLIFNIKSRILGFRIQILGPIQILVGFVNIMILLVVVIHIFIISIHMSKKILFHRTT